jgi:hypothetical protein
MSLTGSFHRVMVSEIAQVLSGARLRLFHGAAQQRFAAAEALASAWDLAAETWYVGQTLFDS